RRRNRAGGRAAAAPGGAGSAPTRGRGSKGGGRARAAELPPRRLTLRTVVAGYDATEPSRRALARAAEIAEAFGAPLVVVAVAAGHPLTAEAGARILAEGGNAVDACIAAAFTSWVVESPLTGPGAGGFMLVHRARDSTTRLLDFFVATPGLGRRAAGAGEME